MDPNIWGPKFWFSLHNISLTYPFYPTDEDKLRYVKWITKSLLFTLIPLHNDDKCVQYYKLINNKYLS